MLIAFGSDEATRYGSIEKSDDDIYKMLNMSQDPSSLLQIGKNDFKTFDGKEKGDDDEYSFDDFEPDRTYNNKSNISNEEEKIDNVEANRLSSMELIMKKWSTMEMEIDAEEAIASSTDQYIEHIEIDNKNEEKVNFFSSICSSFYINSIIKIR
jgi:hypothetical protein